MYEYPKNELFKLEKDENLLENLKYNINKGLSIINKNMDEFFIGN